MRKLIVVGAAAALTLAACSQGENGEARNNDATDQAPSGSVIDTVATVSPDIANDARALEPYGEGQWLIGQYAERGGYNKGAVYVMDAAGVTKQLTTGYSPGSFAVSGQDIYVTVPNQQTVNRMDIETGALTQVLPAPAGDSASGGKLKAGSGCPDSVSAADVRFNWPWGLAIDDDILYIADVNNNCVRRVDLSAEEPVVERVAGLASGAGGFNGEGQAPNQTQLHAPGGLDVDRQGDLFIADTLNQVVWELDVKAKRSGIDIVAGVPKQAGYNGDDRPATQAQLNYPWGVDIDRANVLFIADQRNNRVRVVNNKTILTLAGNGTQGNTGDGGPAIDAELAGPWDVANDDYQNPRFPGALYVSDSANHSVRVVTDRDAIALG